IEIGCHSAFHSHQLRSSVTTFPSTDPIGLIHHDPAAFSVDVEGYLDQAAQRLADGGPAVGASDEAQEAAAAGAEELAAAGARRHRRRIDLVDLVIADAGGEAALQHPAFVQHLAEPVHRLG